MSYIKKLKYCPYMDFSHLPRLYICYLLPTWHPRSTIACLERVVRCDAVKRRREDGAGFNVLGFVLTKKNVLGFVRMCMFGVAEGQEVTRMAVGRDGNGRKLERKSLSRFCFCFFLENVIGYERVGIKKSKWDM